MRGNLQYRDAHLQNVNQRKRKDNKSGYTGIFWYKLAKKWCTQIKINRKRIHLGTFDSKQEALKARNDYILENNLTEYKIQEWEN